ncbi:hypothetical protein ACX9R5_09945 [Rathayibacter sp. CAU 1779]
MSGIRRAAIAVPLAVALAFGSTAALSGCSVQTLVRNITHGSVKVGAHSVPSDFPSEVPLAHGTVLYGVSAGSTGGKIWNVTIRVGGADALDSIAKQITDAGFQQNLDHSGENGGSESFRKDPYTVLVVVTKDDAKGWVANYTVTEKK